MNRVSVIANRVARSLVGDWAQPVLDGKSKSVACSIVTRILNRSANRNIDQTDPKFKPVQDVFDALKRAGIDVDQNEKRDHVVSGRTYSKYWYFMIEFKNNFGEQDRLYGHVVAVSDTNMDRPSFEKYYIEAQLGTR